MGAYNDTMLDGAISQLEPSDPTTATEAKKTAYYHLQLARDTINDRFEAGKNLAKEQLINIISGFTGFEKDKAEAMLPFLENDWLNNFLVKMVKENESPLPIPKNFQLLAEELKYLQLIFSRLTIPVHSIEFLRTNSNDFFGTNTLTTTDIRKPEGLNELVNYWHWYELDHEVTVELLHPMLQECLTDSSKKATKKAFYHYFDFPEVVTADAFPAFIHPTFGGLPVSSNRFDFLRKIKIQAELVHKLGISHILLDRTSSHHNDYTTFREIASQLRAKIKSQFEDESQFESAFEPFNERILEMRRDILCDYIMARPEIEFEDTNEIYGYFLMDPEMGGCMKISRIVAGHLSLQLYVHRVLMNLEQSGDNSFKVFLDSSGQNQWEWKKNYRVWEANRKVAVYAENYIEPEWRDNKSPEFKQLEEELLQQKITMESAEGLIKSIY
ncbi:MAG: neuraminidase-like domain-containing protein [Bacteroidia bacterium]